MAPRLIALLACQEISPDQGDTITLYRVVSSIAMSGFPGTVGGYLFVRVADLEGDHTVRLEMRDSDRGVIVENVEWEVTAAAAREVQDFTVMIDVDVPGPVTIEARILVDGEVIGWTNFEIHRLPEVPQLDSDRTCL